MSYPDTDTISAVATPPGRGGVGIIRVSGPGTAEIAANICGRLPEPREATHCRFSSADGRILDFGIALFFRGPASFTGEDVLELQGHGGVQVLKTLLRRTLECGARMARPGEFTERAFLNEKLDLLQAEAIADLINASSEQAMRSSVRTLQGLFSAHIDTLARQITSIRKNVEAAIDFSDEAVDFMTDTSVSQSLQEINSQLDATLEKARQGALLREGIAVVLAGAPNVGKSTLLNALAGTDTAIVTDIPGTTRDLLREQLDIEGLPVHVTDTAGLRSTSNPVEQEGVRRAQEAIQKADQVLLLVDATRTGLDGDSLAGCLGLLAADENPEEWLERFSNRLCLVINKIDLVEGLDTNRRSTAFLQHELPTVQLSARTGEGLDELRSFLLTSCGFEDAGEEAFIARERHLQVLRQVSRHTHSAELGVRESLHLELIAEELRLAHQLLGTITGKVSSDDLLGEIFASFCLGK